MEKIISIYKNLHIAVKASVWFTICTVLQKGLSVITIPIFTRILTTEQYGVYSVFQSWLSIVTIFATLMLVGGVFNKGLIKFEDDRNAFISSIQGLSNTITTVILLAYLMFHNQINSIFVLNTPNPTVLIIAMFIQLMTNPALGFWSAEQRFDYKYKSLVFVTIFIAIVTPLINLLVVIKSELKSEAWIITTCTINFFAGLVFWIRNFVRGKKFYSKKYWKYALKFNIPLIPHYLSQTVLNQSDRIMINNFCGANQAGIYSVAYSAAMIVTLVTTSINNSYMPWTFKSLKAKEYESLKKISNYILIIVAIMILCFIALAPEIISIFAPKDYYEAIWIIPPVAVSVYFMFLYSLFSNIQFYFEKTKFIMIASIIGAILNVILNWIFIPMYGYLVAGYTTLMCYIVFCLTHYYFMKYISRTNCNSVSFYDINTIIIISCVLLVFSTLLMWLYQVWYVRYIFILIVIILMILKRKLIIEKMQDSFIELL